MCRIFKLKCGSFALEITFIESLSIRIRRGYRRPSSFSILWTYMAALIAGIKFVNSALSVLPATYV